MALQPDPRLADAVSALIGDFSPVYQEWRQMSREPAPATARECLYGDLMKVGLYVSGTDKYNSQREVKFLAEMLALVKTESATLPYGYVVETVDKEIGSAKAATSQIPEGPGGPPELLTAKAVSQWAAGKPERKAAAASVEKRLTDAVNLLVLFDGNVSSQEIATLAGIEKQFAT